MIDAKWWTLGSAYRLEVDHLRAVIDAKRPMAFEKEVDYHAH